MSLIRFLSLSVAATLVAGTALAAKAPKVTAATVELADGAAVSLTVNVEELEICAGAPCFIWLGESFDDDDRSLFLTIDAEGAWSLSGENEHYSKDAKDDDENVLLCKDHTEETKAAAEAEKEEEEEKEEPDEEATPDESWKDKPILSAEERRSRAFDRKTRGKFCTEMASGTLAGDGDEKVLELPSDVLPESDFYVYSNGWFGAYVGDVQIGSSTKMGGIKFDR